MKFSALTYAKAFTSALRESPGKEAEIRERFLALVQRHGDSGALPKILREIVRLTDEETGTRRVKVESARPLKDAYLREFQSVFGEQYKIETSIVPELVAGVRITIDREYVIDASLAGRVKKLFI